MFKKIEKIIKKIEKEYMVDPSDSRLLSKKEWGDRGEDYLKGSPAVFIFEGHWYDIMNFYSPNSEKIQNALDAELKKLGLYFEQGHAWSAGFFEI